MEVEIITDQQTDRPTNKVVQEVRLDLGMREEVDNRDVPHRYYESKNELIYHI